jgi:signal transduction histidine kinase
MVMTKEDPQADRQSAADWVLWGARWLWIVLGALLTADSGPAVRAAIAGYAIVQIALSLSLLDHWHVSDLRWVGVAADVVGPGAGLALAGIPVGPVWVLLLAGANATAVAYGWRVGILGLFGGAVVALVGIGWWLGNLPAALMLVGLHAAVLLPAGLVVVWAAVRRRRAPTAPSRTGPAVRRSLLPPADGEEGAGTLQDPLDPDRLLAHLLSLATDALQMTGLPTKGLSGAALALGPTGWRVAAGELVGEPDGSGDGLLAAAVASGDVQTSQAPQEDPSLAGWASAYDWASVACLPLMDDERCHGVLLFGHRRADAFGPTQVDGLAALGQEARVALHYADLYQSLMRERDQLTELQEEARKKLARDLHDGPTQVIAAIAMRTNFARRQLSIDAAAADEELGKVEEMARETTREIRHMLFTLRPLILESKGLVAALRQYARKVGETHHLQVEVQAADRIGGTLNPEQQGSLFYIAEEAVNNAQKHAAAAKVLIRLRREPDAVVLEVVDNGVGFNVGEVDRTYEQRGSLGMVTMRERTQLLGGEFTVSSREGGGTTIRARIPVH